MQKLITFRHNIYGQIRMLVEDDKNWFVVADICLALKTSAMPTLFCLEAGEKKSCSLDILKNGRPAKGIMTLVTESGVEAFIKYAGGKRAQDFGAWLFFEVRTARPTTEIKPINENVADNPPKTGIDWEAHGVKGYLDTNTGKAYVDAETVAIGLRIRIGASDPRVAWSRVNQCLARAGEKITVRRGDFMPLPAACKLGYFAWNPQAQEFSCKLIDSVVPYVRWLKAKMDLEKVKCCNEGTDVKSLREELEKKENIISGLNVQKSKLENRCKMLETKAAALDLVVERKMRRPLMDTAKELGVTGAYLVDFLLEKKFVKKDDRGNLQPTCCEAEELFEVIEREDSATMGKSSELCVTPKGVETIKLIIDVK